MTVKWSSCMNGVGSAKQEAKAGSGRSLPVSFTRPGETFDKDPDKSGRSD